MKFGENFSFYRKKLCITQEEIADRLFVSRQTVSRWENGAVIPDVEMLICICDLFECDMDTLLRKDASVSEETDTNDSKRKSSYDKHMNKYAVLIAVGVALILIGVTLVVFLNAAPSLELLSVVLLFVFIFFAAAVFIYSGIEHVSFMRENPTAIPYSKEEVNLFSKKFTWYIIIATGLIVLGLIFVVISNYSDKSVPNGMDKTVWEHISVGIFLSFITVAVFLYVYSGMLYSKYNVDEYNTESAKEGFVATDKNEKACKKNRVSDAVSGAIMLSATALFMIFGFFFDAWHPAWAIFPIGALCCGIFSVIYDAFQK